jgi:hypothetical protein
MCTNLITIFSCFQYFWPHCANVKIAVGQCYVSEWCVHVIECLNA